MNQLRLLLRQESMLALNYDDKTARDCISIAASSIDGIHAHYHSPSYRPTDRFSSVLYLVGSLLPLICIIIRSENDGEARADAIDAYQKALSMLKLMSPNFSAARHTLRRLHRVIATTERAIHKFHDAEYIALDPTEFGTETLVPQISEIFNHNYQLDLDMNMLNQQLNGHFMDGMNNMLNFDVSGAAEGVDSFWVDDPSSLFVPV